MTREKSIDIANNDKLVETDMNVPRLLRRNSVVGNMCVNNNHASNNNNIGLNNNNNNLYNQTGSSTKTRTKLPIN